MSSTALTSPPPALEFSVECLEHSKALKCSKCLLWVILLPMACSLKKKQTQTNDAKFSMSLTVTIDWTHCGVCTSCHQILTIFFTSILEIEEGQRIIPLDWRSLDNSATVGHACSLFGPHRQRWIPEAHDNRQGWHMHVSRRIRVKEGTPPIDELV